VVAGDVLEESERVEPERGIKQEFGVIQAQAGLEVLVNEIGGDFFGLERPLATGLAEQALAQQEAKVGDRQRELGGDLAQQACLARTCGADNERELVVGAFGEADGVEELGKGEVGQ
jgi:hypothetical protein